MTARTKRSNAADRPATASPGGRAIRMAAMGMGVAGSYVGYLMQRAFLGEAGRKTRLSAAHAKAARRMTREMQALRGPAMKLGQTLSLQAGILPEEALQELASLQREAPGMHPSLVRVQFKNSMGKSPGELYATFEDSPFAAASLGQVHHATLPDGTKAAVKIQYPGIRDAVAADFAWFRTVSKPAQATGHLPAVAIDELEKLIVAETDYTREADNLEFFKKGLTPLGHVTVPAVRRDLSSTRVITMSLVPGRHLDEFLATRPTQAVRDLIGSRLLELFYFQILRLGALHADPHWGNYLYGADGSIGIVDFGCVKYFRKEFVEDFEALLLYPGSRDTAEFRRQLDRRYIRMGNKVTSAGREALVGFAERFYRRVFPWEPERESERFDFGDVRVLQDYMRESQALFKARSILTEYIFLARTEIGLYQTLYRLRARVATSRIVRSLLRRV